MRQFTVVLEREDDGRYSVYAPDLPGCASWGESKEDALANIQDAIKVYIEGLKADGQSVPAVRASIESVSVRVA